MTIQDDVKKILNDMSNEEFNRYCDILSKIKPFQAAECYPLSKEVRAVMTLKAAKKLEEFFDILKLDYKNDENLNDTPMRVASMYANELMVGRYTLPPRIEAFPADMYLNHDAKIKYDDNIKIELEKRYNRLQEIENVFYCKNDNVISTLLTNKLLTESEALLNEIDLIKGIDNKRPIETMIVKNVDINSLCSHHLISFVSTDDSKSKCSIAYIPALGDSKALLGISKLQRIADWFGRRPQLQEELNWQIKAFISLILRSLDVMVTFTDIIHYCEKTRGVKSHCGSTSSTVFSGRFAQAEYRNFALSISK